MTITDGQSTFLADHRWALIATVGPRARPQVTMVAYHWDGSDLVMSTRHSAAKWRNIADNPEVCVTVTDDERCLSVYGSADPIADDPERARLTDRLLGSLLPAHAAILAADIDRGLDASDRVIIRVTPRRAVGRI